MFVSLCSACATGTPGRTAMTIEQLEYFQPDCAIAQQQMILLNSMRRSPDDQLLSFSGWTGQDRKINWLINWHIRGLRDYC
jgi:hypothetical protein